MADVQAGQEAFAKTGAFKYDYIDFNKKAPIPADWISVACIACSFKDMNFTSCFGCKSNCQCCCFEFVSYSCKCVEHDRVKCICSEDICEIVNFVPKLNCYRQCFCIEVAVGLPAMEGYVEMPAVVKSDTLNFEMADPNDVYPCGAECCCIESCYLKYPECIGCFGKSFMCCLESQSTGFKPIFLDPNREKKDLLCLWSKSHSYIVPFKFECSGVSQTFCRDSRSSFPCNEDVPCLFTGLFITCCVNFGCHPAFFQSLAQLQGAAKDKPMPDAVNKNIAAAQNAASKV